MNKTHLRISGEIEQNLFESLVVATEVEEG